ncbi:MAG: Asp-tRNA(Asn)/Glu-tRNA(Gln) amidotransferase subunit GatB [Oceanospirillaceae bacterium]|mgnify:FL=1|jgi:aspartyl-tRNA(Asn)/glutamyl-tRNA(Gln) amidotransferase subunit B|nr:Asp-tRNA(Asn)/Glu-tRNA(Gln) amidotransferase subunit GatB [Oceanospirillaceae bacterium]MBT4441931.1 Asp-tRNA(Asn)/Glu-tRNA(Gln) amidotransferase subunit GatB [Oceanospirillaceae bacterium]MBT7331109.1 Asp-tRNA(Asn)/Glu-tRNA(Gln) amidotransferase subunit GatB [Oceanospirillaceae bacterium]
MAWEIVIGLEIHVQLATKSKLFSGAKVAFGAEPNTQTTLVDLGMPGALPVFNEQALRMAVTFGTAIDADIGKHSVFARKNYFYPDSPKGYQTSQMDHPIVGIGHLDIQLEDGSTKRIGVTRAHLEEDAGKSLHDDFDGMTGIDLNRSSTPLLEIVSEPDMRSAKEAVAYMRKMHAIVTTIGISDGNMAEGSMRCDANVSVRPKGQEKLGTRAELKNINSFRFIERAINVEVERQIDILEDGGTIAQETRLYDADKNETRPMRSKEEANDYRYFPCPDLLPINIDEAYIDAIRNALPELPDQRSARFVSQLSLSEYDAGVLSASRALADYFEAVVAVCNDAKLGANWVTGELAKFLNQNNMEINAAPVSAEQLGQLISRIKDDTINTKGAKTVFEALWDQTGTVDGIIADKGLKQVSDMGAIEAMVDDVIAASPKQVQQYLDAEVEKRGKMLGFFMGQVMKASKGAANPGQVNGLLKNKLDALC